MLINEMDVILSIKGEEREIIYEKKKFTCEPGRRFFQT